MVGPSEGNEARRRRRDEKSESADTTDEVGELAPEDPAEGSGRPDDGNLRGDRWRGCSETSCCACR